MFYEGAIIANSVTVLALVTIFFALFKNTQLAIAIAVSLLAAKVVTATGTDILHIHALFICAFISIASFNGRKIIPLKVESNEINYAVSFLFMVRMIIELLSPIGLYGTELMWLLTIVFLVLQLTIILGSCINGSRINSAIRNITINTFNMVFKP